MGIPVTDEIIEYLSILTKLKPDDDEKKEIKEDIEKILEYMNILNEVDTADVSLYKNGTGVNAFREDSKEECYINKAIMDNMPEIENEMLVVPKTV